ncbi:hypothetical protein QAD02_009946 [Eretmocerus hayati]|uniref:Uncharacterized protein n=1 Tax=Eretmocerus hayati TaxID=131215 RepID=A0ACC2NBZ6_9HYME|nr:hypothetical protein QAD02_009946 [Eretmocerus hayati]
MLSTALEYLICEVIDKLTEMMFYMVIVPCLLLCQFSYVIETQAFIGEAIGVVSGIMGIYDFLRSRLPESPSEHDDEEDLEREQELSMIAQVSKDMKKLQNRVNNLKEDILFSESISSIKYSTFVPDYRQNEEQNLEENCARIISEWYNKTMQDLKPALSKLSRKLYSCNIPDAKNNGSWIEIKTFKKFFFWRVVHYNEPENLKCTNVIQTKNCPTWTIPGTSCSISHRPCGGKMYNCTLANEVDVCVTNFPEGDRYEYYRSSEGQKIIDNHEKCYVQDLKPEEYLTNPGSLVHLEIVDYRRAPCRCICEEGEYFINTVPAYSDYENNMVVIGAKIVLDGNVLEIRIQQAKLLTYGLVDKSTSEWVGPQKKSLVKISWAESRKILLYTEMLRPGTVLAGLSFYYGPSHHSEDGDKYITLQLFECWYDFKNGLLDGGQEIFRFSPAEKELNVTDADSPKKAVLEEGHEIFSSDVWINLTTSSGMDGGQSTIPFFDGQEVTSDRPIPLSGAGLYYKGGEDFGGFIGIELHTYDNFKVAHFISPNSANSTSQEDQSANLKDTNQRLSITIGEQAGPPIVDNVHSEPSASIDPFSEKLSHMYLKQKMSEDERKILVGCQICDCIVLKHVSKDCIDHKLIEGAMQAAKKRHVKDVLHTKAFEKKMTDLVLADHGLLIQPGGEEVRKKPRSKSRAAANKMVTFQDNNQKQVVETVDSSQSEKNEKGIEESKDESTEDENEKTAVIDEKPLKTEKNAS